MFKEIEYVIGDTPHRVSFLLIVGIRNDGYGIQYIFPIQYKNK